MQRYLDNAGWFCAAALLAALFIVAELGAQPRHETFFEWLTGFLTNIKITDFLLAAFTGLLAVYTGRLFRATASLASLERPWLFIEGATVSRRELPGQALIDNNFWIEFRCRNVGRIPAVVEECIIKFEEKSKLGLAPDYSNAVPLSTQRWASPNEPFETGKVGPGPRPGMLVAYGRITYSELNGKTHRTGFAVEVSPHIAAFSGYPNTAYDYYD